MRSINHCHQSIDDFSQVVWRDLGRHTDSDPLGTVNQQVGIFARQHQRFFKRIVVVGPEIDCFLVDVVKQFVGQAVHANLGITHRRSRIAIDRTEISLAVNQRIAHGKILRHSYDGVIHGGVTMRVILTDDVTNDTG